MSKSVKIFFGGVLTFALALWLMWMALAAVLTGGAASVAAACQPDGAVVAAASTGAPGVSTAPFKVDGRPATTEQVTNANLIKKIGVGRGEENWKIRLAMGTALQEARLRNPAGGHLDSLGIFQMRPSVKYANGKPYWGTPSQIMDPVYSINRHFDEINKIHKKENLERLPLVEAAIKVQNPDKGIYRRTWKWDKLAAQIVAGASGDQVKAGNVPQQVVFASLEDCAASADNIEGAVMAALEKVGTPYNWEAKKEVGNYDGSGLTQWAYGRVGVELPVNAATQWNKGTKVKDRASIRRGDLLYWGASSSASPTRVAIYLGNDQIVQAPAHGKLVAVVPVTWEGYLGATRPVEKAIALAAAKSPSRSGAIPASAPQSGWVTPIKSGYTLTSHFNPRRFDPIAKRIIPHNGTDLAAVSGKPIRAVNEGVVSLITFRPNGYGNYIEVNHGGKLKTGYAHMLNVASGLEIGDPVVAGQVIGYVGTTGWSTGNHLHFNVIKSGTHINPVPFMRSVGAPL